MTEKCVDCGSTTRQLLDTDEVKARYGFRVKLVGKRDIACWRKLRNARRERTRNARQVRTFGLTAEQGDLVVEFQGGGCICAKWTGYNGASRSLSTDHDHTTGEVRGKLCKHCNDLLGRVKDDPDYFRRMIAYLENPPAKRLFGSVVVPGHPPPARPPSCEQLGCMLPWEPGMAVRDVEGRHEHEWEG